MPAKTILRNGSLSVIDYCCSAGPGDKPFIELHGAHSVSYVRKGSFGYHARGAAFELVAGSIMVGHPGDEYLCTHDHHACGDECLSLHLTPEMAASLGGSTTVWRSGAVPPLPELMVLGELAQAAVAGDNALGVDEIGLWLASRLVETVSARKPRPPRS
jgi:AraC family transcriptional regulator